MNYTHILFDLDGTLTESGQGITNSVKYALQKMGKKPLPMETLQKFIGPPLAQSFMEFCGCSQEEAADAILVYREYYREKGMYENRVYPGIQDMLADLKKAGLHLAVATSKPELLSCMILDHFQLRQYFDVICGATMDEKRVKKGEIITCALEALQIKEEEKNKVLMVGDRHHDVDGAKENQIACLGVLFGYGSKEELEDAGACAFAQTASEVTSWILGQVSV